MNEIPWDPKAMNWLLRDLRMWGKITKRIVPADLANLPQNDRWAAEYLMEYVASAAKGTAL